MNPTDASGFFKTDCCRAMSGGVGYVLWPVAPLSDVRRCLSVGGQP